VSGSNPDPDPLIGTLLADRYRIFSLLGEGGMGRVYSGEHALMRKRVAVKVLHRELTQMPEVVARFEREAMAAANIDHPNIAAATDFGKLPNGSVFLVLEYVQGRGLRELIDEGPLLVDRALNIARQIASALVSAHALGIVHRDLKPENVMLVEKSGDPDFVKVLDFGIAKVPVKDVSERGSIRPAKVITRVGMIFGTPEYMAPEQALGQNVDARADLYALGIVLYEMLCGRRPFSAESPVGILGQQLQGPLPTFAKRAPHVKVPFVLEQLTLRLLAPTAGSRFQSAVELTTAFETIQAQLALRNLDSKGRAPMASGPLGRISNPQLFDPPPSSNAQVVIDSAQFAASANMDDALNASTMPAPVYDIKATRRSYDTHQGFRSVLHSSARRNKRRILMWGIGGALLSIVVVLSWLALRPAKPTAKLVTSATATAARPDIAPAVSAPPETASEARIAQARSAGLAALSELAKEYPKDSKIWIELARAQLASGNASAAVEAASQAYAADQAASKDAKLATVLWKAAQKRESSEKTLRLLEGGFGERGIDILYDLSTTAGVRRDLKKAALDALFTMAAQTAASPALKVLLALEHAKTCEEKRALLSSVENDGDARSIPLLSAMHSNVGCGKRRRSDCYSCLRNGLQLENTIAAVKKREGL
jgi:serine/threonine-protein kinase